MEGVIPLRNLALQVWLWPVRSRFLSYALIMFLGILELHFWGCFTLILAMLISISRFYVCKSCVNLGFFWMENSGYSCLEEDSGAHGSTLQTIFWSTGTLVQQCCIIFRWYLQLGGPRLFDLLISKVRTLSFIKLHTHRTPFSMEFGELWWDLLQSGYSTLPPTATLYVKWV